MKRFVGIDFSGDHKKWAANCRSSNVWIANVRSENGLRLEKVIRVQQLDGEGHPFSDLSNSSGAVSSQR
jgi:hypothetical protein